MHTPQNQNPENKSFSVTFHVPAASQEKANELLKNLFAEIVLLKAGIKNFPDLLNAVCDKLKNSNELHMIEIADRLEFLCGDGLEVRFDEADAYPPSQS